MTSNDINKEQLKNSLRTVADMMIDAVVNGKDREGSPREFEKAADAAKAAVRSIRRSGSGKAVDAALGKYGKREEAHIQSYLRKNDIPGKARKAVLAAFGELIDELRNE